MASLAPEDTPDEWMTKMITSGANEKTPEWMNGAVVALWFYRDDIGIILGY